MGWKLVAPKLLETWIFFICHLNLMFFSFFSLWLMQKKIFCSDWEGFFSNGTLTPIQNSEHTNGPFCIRLGQSKIPIVHFILSEKSFIFFKLYYFIHVLFMLLNSSIIMIRLSHYSFLRSVNYLLLNIAACFHF